MQSDQKDCYNQVGLLLQNNVPVLYSGCPCQIAGLKGYLGQIGLDQDSLQKLITVDLLCHGTPSPKMHLEHLQYLCGSDNIERLEMRSRTKAKTGYYIQLKNGVTIERNGLRDLYINAFLNHLILRRSCHGCAFSRLPRQGDITIGDFWDAKKLNVGDKYDNKSSIVLINSEKGQHLWQTVIGVKDSDFSCVHLNECADVKSLNHNIYRPSVESDYKLRDIFFNNYKTMPFEKAVIASLFDYDVGLCLHMSNNYGSTATNYALYHTIEKLGYNPIILDNIVPVDGVSNSFMKKNLAYSGKLFEPEDWKSVRDLVDTFVLGSDQSLNWDFSHNIKSLEFLLLSFTHDYQKRIAYSPSFGDNRESVSNPLVQSVYTNALARFQHFSVREDYGVKMAKKLFQKDATHVLDPVFLLNREDYTKIAAESTIEGKQKFLFAYILQLSPEKERLIHAMAEQHGCKAIIIGDAKNEKPLYNDAIRFASDGRIEFVDWLACFNQADRVITDSFHGVCFSLLLGKPFIAIKARQTNRFDAIAKLIADADPNSRVFFYSNADEALETESAFNECDNEKIWDYFNSIADTNREWLRNALAASIDHPDSDDNNDSTLFDSVRLLKQTLLFQTACDTNTILSKKANIELELQSKSSNTELFKLTDVTPETNYKITEKTTSKDFRYKAVLRPSYVGKQRIVLQCLESGKLVIRLKGNKPSDIDGYYIESKVKYDMLKINGNVIFDSAKYAGHKEPIVVTKKVSKGSTIMIDIQWTSDSINAGDEKMKFNLDSGKRKALMRKAKQIISKS